MPHIDDGTLNALLDSELDEAEARAVESHLGQCAECRARYEDARSFLVEAGELIGLLTPPGASLAPEQAPPARRVSKTAKEAAIDLDAGTQKSPAIRPLFPQGERRTSTTQKERAIDAPTGASPAIDLPTGVSPAIGAALPAGDAEPEHAAPGIAPLPRRSFNYERLAWAASVVLALGVGYLANEVRLTRIMMANAGLAMDTATPPLALAPAPAPAATTDAGDAAPPRAERVGRAAAQNGSALPPIVRRDKPPTAAEAADAALRGAERSRVPASPTEGLGASRDQPGASGPPATRGGAPTGSLAQSPAPASVPPVSAPTEQRRETPRQLARMAAGAAREGDALADAEVQPVRFRAITSDEAILRLSGSIRLIDGLDPRRYEIGAGRLVPGSDPDRDVIRVLYTDPRGRPLTLDQQPGSTSADAAPGSVNGLMRGDTLMTSTPEGGIRIRWVDRKSFWLSLTGTLPVDSMRALVERIR